MYSKFNLSIVNMLIFADNKHGKKCWYADIAHANMIMYV